MEEKYKKLDPFGEHTDKLLHDQDVSGIHSGKSAKTFNKKDRLEDYNESDPTMFKPFFKTNKKMHFIAGMDKSYHGISTLPSDNIKNIVNHGFAKDFLEERTKKEQDLLLKLLLKEENTRGLETKASIMRNQAIKDKIENFTKKQAPFKLKQYDEVKPSDYISDTTKEIRKKYKENVSKKSNIETDSVLKIADLTNKAQKEGDKQKVESKQHFVGDEVEKLKSQGTEIYSYDIQKNQMTDRFAGGPHLGAHAIASRLRLHRNPYKDLNKSVDGRFGSKRGKSSLHKTKNEELNSSMLPDIKTQAQRRNISQIRKDEGEYSRMLANHNNNRLVMAQHTIDEALRKQRAQMPTKKERNNLGK